LREVAAGAAKPLKALFPSPLLLPSAEKTMFYSTSEMERDHQSPVRGRTCEWKGEEGKKRKRRTTHNSLSILVLRPHSFHLRRLDGVDLVREAEKRKRRNG
jgi:hypothetical protein